MTKADSPLLRRRGLSAFSNISPRLRRTSRLGSVATQVLDADRMVPCDLINRNSERRGQPLAIRGARSIVPADNRSYALGIESGGGDQLINIQAALLQTGRHGFHSGYDVITVYSS